MLNTALTTRPENLCFAKRLALALGGLFLATAPLPAQLLISTPPQNLSVRVGSTAFFTVAATGTPPLTYQWRKDGTDFLGSTGATCALGLARPNQAGSYTVVVSNLLGSVTSAPPAVLTVSPATPGTVMTWGDNYSGQTTVPVAAQNGVTAIAAGGDYTVALLGAVLPRPFMVFACDDFKLSLLRSAAAPYNSPMTYAETVRSGGRAALQAAESFLMRSGPVYETLRRITDRLSELGIPYSVAGGMALVAHGHNRTTVDVDILVTAEGLLRIHQALDGLGYVPPFAGSKSLRDTTTAVRIEFLVCGAFPGDGKPKPIAFPDPAEAAVAIDGINYLRLPHLIELKLASGMTGGVARLKDFADVVELIRLLRLDERFATQLNPYVRDKFTELKRGLDASPGAE